MFQFPKNTISYWRESVDIGKYPAVDENMSFDVGIVGGGITGITLAYLLSDYDISVCVIEADQLLSGTTGNTTAKITTQHGLIYNELINQYGIEFAQQYYEANKRALQFINDTVVKHHIDCQLQEANAYLYSIESQNTEKLEKELLAYEKLRILGDITKQTELPFDLTALKMERQAHFHPLRYLQHLINYCIENSVSFFENTRAIAIEYSKKPIIVCENEHRITCKYVVQASHYPFFDGQQFFPLKMYAERSYALLAKTNTIVKDMYVSIDESVRSIRPTTVNNETQLIIAGENHRTGASELPTNDHYELLAHFTDQHFHLEQIINYWSAQDYTTIDQIPYIGTITKEKQNVFVATGYRKWGMTNGTNAALMIKNLILEQEDEYIDIFAPYRDMKFDPSFKKIVSYNVEVAKHLIKGKFDNTNEEIKQLKDDEAIITMMEGQRIGVYKDTSGELHAVDTTCTHLGCELDWNEAEKSWDCPCHGSRFSYKGDVLNGPAVKNLKTREDLIKKQIIMKQQ